MGKQGEKGGAASTGSEPPWQLLRKRSLARNHLGNSTGSPWEMQQPRPPLVSPPDITIPTGILAKKKVEPELPPV